MNNIRFTFFCSALATAIFGAYPTLGQPGDISVQLVKIINYPRSTGYAIGGTGQVNDDGTFAAIIQHNTTVAGALIDPSGHFSPPFSFPGDIGNTIPFGVNNQDLVCGFYLSDKFHGFFRFNNGFKSYDAPLENIASTTVESVNDAGNFVGQAVSGGVATAYAVIDGDFISILTLNNARASGINSLNEAVGSYDTGSQVHGFFRAADGTLTKPIIFPRALQTMPRAINDSGYIVGSWTTNGANHGFVMHLPDTFLNFKVPDSKTTVITGINASGLMCGYYQDEGSVAHGFIAQLIVE